MDTIYALASARGRAGVAVVRVSGPDAFAVSAQMLSDVPARRGVRVVRDLDGEPLDEALVLTFNKGASFTGEDVIEFHLHGSTAVVSSVLMTLAKTKARLAEPGEFTRRALENGNLDLPQVEGLADLIEAETEAQRKQAFQIMQGSLSDKCDGWRQDLLRAIALMEVTIDFADEEIPEDVSPEVLNLIQSARASMQTEVAGNIMAERIRDGFEVAIVGRPNAGKSTLLNALAGRDAAITSEIAGTTRDVIEVRMDLNGLPVTLLDTAGLRDTEDKIETLGISRARSRAQNADIRVFLLDGNGLDDFGVTVEVGDIEVEGKADLSSPSSFGVSGKTGEGIEELLSQLSEELDKRAAGATSLIRERHRLAILSGIRALDQAEAHVKSGAEWSELAAEEMRQALGALDILIGRVDVENVLDVIFSSFCLGK